MTCPRVLFLDGAGWYSGDGPVREGLRRAEFKGAVERFNWQGLLGPLPDHMTAGAGHPRVRALAHRIAGLRRANPDGRIVVMGYSAGTGLVVAALEILPDDVAVDHVVLLAPSVSNHHDLRNALRHVKGRLYATSSSRDSVLSTASSAGGEGGEPAGIAGFVPMSDPNGEGRVLYEKVVNLRWRPAYLAFGWDGGHMSITSPEFIHTVIAPRILQDIPHPLDEPKAEKEAEKDE